MSRDPGLQPEPELPFSGMKRLLRAALAATLLSLVPGPGGAMASEALWALLKGGGQVVLMRHAVTTPGVGDPPGMRLDDCPSQRNLTDEGRRHARRTGDTFRERGAVVDRLLASPWCRCLETARLAFGTDAQKTTYLPRLVKGEVLGAWGLTEASAGSDAAGMRTTNVAYGGEDRRSQQEPEQELRGEASFRGR